MKKMMDLFYRIHKKMGIRNEILCLVIIFVIIFSSLYATFSLSVTSEGLSVIDGVKTFKFVLGDDSLLDSVTIASGSSKNIAITVLNKDEIDLKYGIYYSSFDDLGDVDLGYLHTSEYLPEGVIPANREYIVTIRVNNRSDEAKTISFGLVYGLLKGGDLVLGEEQHFLKEMWNFPLSEVKKGSYVKYVGGNGCMEGECEGVNANTLENSNGSCGSDSYNYNYSGWRVAYTYRGSAYLISAGAPECLDVKDINSSSLKQEINKIALKYCNLDFAAGGICNINNSWAISDIDFQHITGNKLVGEMCFDNSENKNCGYQNDLVDVGSYYWLSRRSDDVIYYQPEGSFYSLKASDVSKGVRPILKMASSVIVVGGKGIYEDPYQIENTMVANYEYTIVYNGNGATGGDTENSIHRTNVLKKLNKNQFTLSYQVNSSLMAVFDDSYCDDDGVCHEASERSNTVKNALFLGWSTSPYDKEAMYTDEQEVVNLSTSSKEVIVNLYAIWKYDALVLPNIQERDGYDILGWYTSKDGGELVGKPGDEYTSLEKVTLYARWEKKNS